METQPEPETLPPTQSMLPEPLDTAKRQLDFEAPDVGGSEPAGPKKDRQVHTKSGLSRF